MSKKEQGESVVGIKLKSQNINYQEIQNIDIKRIHSKPYSLTAKNENNIA